jgi:hypothetical protein
MSLAVMPGLVPAMTDEKDHAPAKCRADAAMKRGLPLLMFFVALCTAPAFATIVPSCLSAQDAVHAQQEEAWIRRCAAAQHNSGAISEAENNCRQWLETCRRAPPAAARPGFMTY